jgi:hypothetical protein
MEQNPCSVTWCVALATGERLYNYPERSTGSSIQLRAGAPVCNVHILNAPDLPSKPLVPRRTAECFWPTPWER